MAQVLESRESSLSCGQRARHVSERRVREMNDNGFENKGRVHEPRNPRSWKRQAEADRISRNE